MEVSLSIFLFCDKNRYSGNTPKQVSDWERPLESWGKRLAAGLFKIFQTCYLKNSKSLLKIWSCLLQVLREEVRFRQKEEKQMMLALKKILIKCEIL